MTSLVTDAGRAYVIARLRCGMSADFIQQLSALRDEYVSTRDDVDKDERWETCRSYAQEELDDFIEWLKSKQEAQAVIE